MKNHKYDVIICGGGPAGIAAASMAARLGVKVLLLERYGRLGGMAVTSLVQPIMGWCRSRFVDKLIARLGGHEVNFEQFDILAADEIQRNGGEIFLHCLVTGVRMDGNRVTAIQCATKAGQIEIAGQVFIDATGDGDVACYAGAEFEQGRPGDGLMQPTSIMYRISGIDETRAFVCQSEEQSNQIRIEGRTWHEIVAQGQKTGELDAAIGVIRLYATRRPGERAVNATQVNNINGLDVVDLTRAEIAGRKQAFQVLAFLQRWAPGFEKAYISVMPAVVGVRETRRVLGLKYLTREDVISGHRRTDAVVSEAIFPIDIHNPDGSGQAEGFAAHCQPYDIPYGCLVPKTIDGLILSGRCISGSHDAHASYRIMGIVMGTGMAAGAAAALSCRLNVQPRSLEAAAIRQAIATQEEALKE